MTLLTLVLDFVSKQLLSPHFPLIFRRVLDINETPGSSALRRVHLDVDRRVCLARPLLSNLLLSLRLC